MSYDIGIHLPVQVEQLLEAIAKSDMRGINISLNNIKEIITDETFHKGLNEYQKEFENFTQEVEKNVINAVKNPSEIKTMDDILNIVNQGIKDSGSAYGEYIDKIKTYILEWIKKYPDTNERQ